MPKSDSLTISGKPGRISGGCQQDRREQQAVIQPRPERDGHRHLSTYTISDGHGGTDTGTMTVDVTPVNDAPAGTDKTVTTLEDTAYTFTAADFGFTDPNDSPANACSR